MSTLVENKISKWVEETIIGLNLCPFAKKPFLEKTLRVKSSPASSDEEMFDFFLDELNLLQAHREISTSLVCFENGHKDFIHFYHLVGSFEDTIKQLKLDSEFQIVCFHPLFVFENTDSSSRINYVNRSIVPLVHIIRSYDIEMALKSPEEGKQISENNELTLNNLTDEEFQYHFNIKQEGK